MLAALDKPVIAAIHGFAIGAGVELSLLCDIRIAAEGTWFSVPEVTLGLIPGAGGSQTLPRTVRRAHALELILTGKRIDTAHALRIGLVSRVVSAEELSITAQRVAERIVSRAPLAVRAAKKAINLGLGLPLREGLALERRLLREISSSQDRLEGAHAFRERREPHFLGR